MTVAGRILNKHSDSRQAAIPPACEFNLELATPHNKDTKYYTESLTRICCCCCWM